MTHSDNPNWWQRNYRWAIPVSVVGVILLITGCILAFGYGLMTLMKSNDAYQNALERAGNSPIVEAQIGSPIEEGLFVAGKIQTHNNTGTATLNFPIKGPKGDGKVHLEAIKKEGQWYFKRLVFQKVGEKTIHNLLPPKRPLNLRPTTKK